MPTEGRTLAQRLSKLEAEMAAMRAEQLESDRLSNSVERLGVGATDLAHTLATVDKNQQVLTRLGQELKQVKRESASKEDLQQSEKRAKALIKEKRRRNVITALLVAGTLLAVLAIMITFAVLYEQDQRDKDRIRRETSIAACEKRNEQAQIMADLFTTFLGQVPAERKDSPSVKALRQSLTRFKELITDCTKLK